MIVTAPKYGGIQRGQGSVLGVVSHSSLREEMSSAVCSYILFNALWL